MVRVILHLRAWYWEVRCLNAYLRPAKYSPRQLEVLHEHRHIAAVSARTGIWETA